MASTSAGAPKINRQSRILNFISKDLDNTFSDNVVQQENHTLSSLARPHGAGYISRVPDKRGAGQDFQIRGSQPSSPRGTIRQGGFPKCII
jgi:hypothetical protein